VIVKMKKLFLVVLKKDVIDVLAKLRTLGSVHVEHQEPLKGYDLNEFRQEVDELEKVTTTLIDLKQEAPQEIVEDWREPTNLILERLAEIDRYHESILKRNQLILQWEPWGSFNVNDIESLKEKEIKTVLVKKKVSNKERFCSSIIATKVFTSNGYDHFILLSQKDINVGLEQIALPAISLDEMKTLQTQEQQKIEEAQKDINEQVKYLEFLKKQLSQSNESLTFEEVATGMKKDEQLAILKGFIPLENADQLKDSSKKHNWALILEDVTDEDSVPTALKNPKWVNLIKPVLNFVDVLPGYREMDVSMVFLIFFSLFFGMLIGDAAYGLIFMGITFVAQVKLGPKLKDKTVFYMMYLLTAMTIIWGVLTGTYFGQAWVKTIIPPVVPWLNDMNNLIYLCFLIAAIHLTIARVWQIILLFPSIKFLSQVGWLAMVWIMFIGANMFVLSANPPGFTMALLVVGAALIILFTKPNKNPLKAIGPGIGDFLMNFINAFTDVVSYIRLFAVGLATVAVADAFNGMAMGVGFGNIPKGIGTGLILILGHSLNMVLAGLAVLVHGIRLNVLEFPGHLNLEWGGFMYKPFENNKK
jgi:V/A-type H+-transporting ATPase subunit I